MNEQLKTVLFSKENYNLLYRSIKENTFAKYENYDIDANEYELVCRDIIKQSLDIAIYQSKERDTLQSLNKTVLVHSLPKSYRYVTQNASFKKVDQVPVCLQDPIIPLTPTTIPETNKQQPPVHILTSPYHNSALTAITSLTRDLPHNRQYHSPYCFSFSLNQRYIELENNDRHYIEQSYLENEFEVIGIILYKKINDPNEFTLSVTINEMSVDELILEKQRNHFYFYKPLLPMILPISNQYQVRIHHISNLLEIKDYTYITHLQYQEETKQLKITVSEELYLLPGHLINVSMLLMADESELQLQDEIVTHYQEKVIIIEHYHSYKDIDCEATGILINKTVQTKIIVSKFS